MYVLKEVPEDFVVEEIPRGGTYAAPGDAATGGDATSAGPYLIVEVKKRNWNSESVAKLLAHVCGIPRKDVGYAGAKDRYAVTTQRYSLKGVPEGRVLSFAHPDISLFPVGRARKPLSLGDLDGNRFRIIVRNLAPDAPTAGTVAALEPAPLPAGVREITFPNYFDEQRFGRSFGRNNVVVGHALVKKSFAAAATLLAQNHKEVADALQERPDDAVGAIQRLSRRTLLLYIHAYQSWLWNEMLAAILRTGDGMEQVYSEGKLVFRETYPALSLPLLGFGTEVETLPEPVRVAASDILAAEQLSPRDFILPQLQRLSSEGGERAASVTTVVTAGAAEPDDLHSGRRKQLLEFSLPPGAYATMLVRALYSP